MEKERKRNKLGKCICGLPEEACVCDELCGHETKQPRIIIDTTKEHKTIIRGIKEGQNDFLRMLRKKFKCCGSTKGTEVILHGDYSQEIRQMLHSLPPLFF